MTGRELNDKWKIGARQTHYVRDGNYFHPLDQFPGALCDANGYMLFSTNAEYEACEFLQRGKRLNVRDGISNIPGYIRMTAARPEQLATAPGIAGIVSELNRRAPGYLVGSLQTIRAEIKGWRPPVSSSAKRLFRQTKQSPYGDYAFHYGGGLELQFNVGFEPQDREFRHGVAFSFEPSRNKPWLELQTTLRPKVKHFNDFLEMNRGLFSDFRMWHAQHNMSVGTDEIPGPIPWQRTEKEGMFIVLGRRQDSGYIDYDAILTDMDRLLPLYKYVESGGASDISNSRTAGFTFVPAEWKSRQTSTSATPAQRELDVALRHNELQAALYRRLISLHGKNNVTYENPCGEGTRVDIVVQSKDEYWFYEIKTAPSPRACLREAIGQLLEYAFWPVAPNVTRLVVVGEAPIDKDGAEYLRALKQRFSLPLEYAQVSIE